METPMQGQSPTMTGSSTFTDSAAAAAAPPPHRPARSVRRPNNAAVTGSGESKASKLAQAIQRDERERNRDRMSYRSASPSGSMDGGDPYAGGEVHSGSGGDRHRQQQLKESPVLSKAISAFTAAGKGAAAGKVSSGSSSPSSGNNAAARSRTDDRSNHAGNDDRATSRNRRGAVGVQGESARARKTAAAPALPSNPAFREMERVLEQVAQEWPELLPPDLAARPANGDAGGGENGPDDDGEDTFDPVTLALALVDPAADSRQEDRFRSFLSTKDALHRSLQSSIRTHYGTFDASVSAYNGLLSNMTHAQRNAATLRSALEDVREMLGKGRAELGVLEARRTELNEIDKILVAIETLKNVPDVLETLMSEKRFLKAAVLLVRSLKMINKQDLREVQATADLRAYFVSQENVSYGFARPLRHAATSAKSIRQAPRMKNPADATGPPFPLLMRIAYA